MSRRFQRHLICRTPITNRIHPPRDPMSMRTSLFWGPLVLFALSGCAANNALQPATAPVTATALPAHTATTTAPAPVANAASSVLASIAIERVTGEKNSQAGFGNNQ
jgi:hypothetical protein